ncbi:MAG: hypothetical protein AAFQ82_04355 [Myxococcota bacterium]
MRVRLFIPVVSLACACATVTDTSTSSGRLPSYGPAGEGRPSLASYRAPESSYPSRSESRRTAPAGSREKTAYSSPEAPPRSVEDERAAAAAREIERELASTANPAYDRAPSTSRAAAKPASTLKSSPIASAAAEEFATLDVRVAGRDGVECAVSVNGHSVGSTPVVALEVPLGKSPVRVICSERERFFDLMRFAPGDQLKVVVMVRELGESARPKKKRRARRRRRSP